MGRSDPVSAEITLEREEELEVGAPADVQPRRRSAVRTTVAWVALAGLFLFTFEMTCRIEDWIRFRSPILSPITSWEHLLIRDRDGMHARPNARFRKWVINA